MIYMITALLICVAMMAELVGTLQAGLGSFANLFAGERYRGWKLVGLSLAGLAGVGAAANFYQMNLSRKSSHDGGTYSTRAKGDSDLRLFCLNGGGRGGRN